MITREVFPKPLGQIVEGISKTAKKAENEYGKSIKVDDFIAALQKEKGKIADHSGVFYVPLPSAVPYVGNGLDKPQDLGMNEFLQTGFARASGLFKKRETETEIKRETWRDLLENTNTVIFNENDYEGVAAALGGNPWIIACMNHGMDMLEFPVIPSIRYHGVAHRIRMVTTEKGSGISFEQLIAENKVFICMSIFLSTDLFFEDSARYLRQPEGRARFLRELYQQVSMRR